MRISETGEAYWKSKGLATPRTQTPVPMPMIDDRGVGERISDWFKDMLERRRLARAEREAREAAIRSRQENPDLDHEDRRDENITEVHQNDDTYNSESSDLGR